MEDANLYSIYNSCQKQGVLSFLDEFFPQLSWPFKTENVLDIGCGPGDITANILLPRLPVSTTMTGVDISKPMVDHANKTFAKESVKFVTMDFSRNNILSILEEKAFTKIFSFYCIHWLKDQEQVAKNVCSLLCPGGEFLILMTSPKHDIYTIYKCLAQTDQWKPYMQNLNDYLPCFFGSTNPCDDFKRIWSQQGLKILFIEERERTVSFPNVNVLLRSVEATNPFVKEMNEETRQQYMADYQRLVEEKGCITTASNGEVSWENQVIVIHGKLL